MWCDVVPMDAYHLLLGRPWQYDRRVVHDGFKNTYTFVKDGIKVTLGPSKLESIPKPSKGEGSNLILSKFDFNKSLEEIDEAFALVVVEENEEKHEVPTLLEPPLHEFQDIILDEIPPSLPPMRDIQHCIDLIPGAMLPNKSAYRMNPKENEEL